MSADPSSSPGAATARARAAAAILVTAAVLLRTVVFVWWEQASFDSDQAVIGLMAKHLSEGSAFPLFFYGQNYLLAVQAWMAAPVFLVMGPTVLALKLPLVVINVLTALLLVRVSVEPFLYVLLIWMLRDRPLWQGAVLGFGFLHREFTAYGFAAFLAVAAIDRSLFTRRRLLGAVTAMAAAVGVWLLVWAIRPYTSGAGPGTTPLDVYGATNNVRSLLDRVCGEPALIAGGFGTLIGSYLGLPLGLTPAGLPDFFVNSTLTQGAWWAWPVFAVAALAGFVRVAWLMARRSLTASVTLAGGAVYLVFVGVIASVAYTVGRCGDLHVLTMRYVLLAILTPVGLAAAWLRLEPAPRVRQAVCAGILAWVAASAVGHARLIDEYVRRTPPAYRRALADDLVANRIRLIRTDYWTGYHVAFLSRERVVADTDGVWRVLQYHRWAVERPRSVYEVRRRPCDGPGREAVPKVYWVCDPPE